MSAGDERTMPYSLTLDLFMRAYITDDDTLVRFGAAPGDPAKPWQVYFADFKTAVRHGWQDAIDAAVVASIRADHERDKREAAEAEVVRLRELIAAVSSAAQAAESSR